MFVINPIVRAPRTSEMALSSQVKESVNHAATSLREALAFAARAEHPTIIHSITDILVRLESLEAIDEIMEKFGSTQPSHRWGKSVKIFEIEPKPLSYPFWFLTLGPSIRHSSRTRGCACWPYWQAQRGWDPQPPLLLCSVGCSQFWGPPLVRVAFPGLRLSPGFPGQGDGLPCPIDSRVRRGPIRQARRIRHETPWSK